MTSRYQAEKTLRESAEAFTAEQAAEIASLKKQIGELRRTNATWITRTRDAQKALALREDQIDVLTTWLEAHPNLVRQGSTVDNVLRLLTFHAAECLPQADDLVPAWNDALSDARPILALR